MNIILREAAEADLPSLLILYRQLGQDDGTVLDPVEARRIFSRIRTYPDYRIYVACMAEKIIGTFALLIMDNLGHKGAVSAVLEDVVVAEELRGQGVGRRMMAFVGEICREKRCYKISLSSNRIREAAHRFYESMGFLRHGYSFQIEGSKHMGPARETKAESPIMKFRCS